LSKHEAEEDQGKVQLRRSRTGKGAHYARARIPAPVCIQAVRATVYKFHSQPTMIVKRCPPDEHTGIAKKFNSMEE